MLCSPTSWSVSCIYCMSVHDTGALKRAWNPRGSGLPPTGLISEYFHLHPKCQSPWPVPRCAETAEKAVTSNVVSGDLPSRLLVTQSCLTLCNLADCSPARLLCPWSSPGKNTGLGFSFLLQGIFPTQGSNPCLLQCRQILYCLSPQGSPFAS